MKKGIMNTSFRPLLFAWILGAALQSGCRSGGDETTEKEFHTSGSREADQRAEQRVSKEQQLHGEGEGGKKEKEVRATLYERLGSEAGVRKIVDDFVDRVMADPRVNWVRKDVKRGGVLGAGGTSAEWKPTPEKVEALKIHLAQFIAVATGGPSQYEGVQMAKVHSGMKITNPEFDASIGDLKASLDALKVPSEEQKELLSVFESTRPQTVEKR
ncbi:MAG TPA: group 1 truncated hemoglobin [Planctomycetota bacterium]|jgi:hemoglobin|nr:group 1 truncated hemoglobin [Planctomycetota bacterium]